MSWYRKSPRVKEPPKHLPHHRTSPATEKMLEAAKKTVKETGKVPKNHK
jgi:hypothetical protein